METVQVGTLTVGDTFVMPWRPPGTQAGRVTHVGAGSVTVKIPRVEGDGWEKDGYVISPGALVVPCESEEFFTQGFGKTETSGRMRNRSEAKKPVDIVWTLCDEMLTRGVKPTTVERDKVVAAALEQGVNENTAKTQFYKWRKTFS